MEYLKPLLIFLALFLLTSLLCWVANRLLIVSPLFAIGLFLLGIPGVVVLVDWLYAKQFL